MRKVLLAAAGVLLVGVSFSEAGQGRHATVRTEPARVQRAAVRGDVHVVFSSGDVRVLREYYTPRYRNLPPGLRKKVARTGQLPPGWERRVQPLPVVVERQLVVLPTDYRRGVIDGNAVIYAPRTGIIIDATVLF